MAQAARTIRWGILGTGNIAGQFARGLRHCPGAELYAVASRSYDKAREFGRQFGLTRCHGSYSALLEDPVDVVYIATPHSVHRDNMLMCLEAGKAVLCEKPLTVNARQAVEAIDLAQRRGLFLMEAMWTAFLPPIVRLRELLAEGHIGEVRIVSADLGFRLEWDPAGRLFNPALAGGCLLDVGIYPLWLATMVLGEPKTVSGQATLCPTGVDEQVALSLGYEGGRLASLYAAIRVDTLRQAVIVGSEGSIHLHPGWWKGGLMTAAVGSRSWQIDLPVEGNGYQYEADEVCRCIREGRTQSDVMPLSQSMAVMRTMDRLRAQWGLKYPME